MRVIIAGSRSIYSYLVLKAAILNAAEIGIYPSLIISGTAMGVDQLGERYSREQGLPLERYPADWKRNGRSAGYMRNEQMAKVAEGLIAVWDGESAGTRHMINLANFYKLKVHVERVEVGRLKQCPAPKVR